MSAAGRHIWGSRFREALSGLVALRLSGELGCRGKEGRELERCCGAAAESPGLAAARQVALTTRPWRLQKIGRIDGSSPNLRLILMESSARAMDADDTPLRSEFRIRTASGSFRAVRRRSHRRECRRST